MTSRPLLLVATERHVERALASGARATTWSAFVKSLALAGPRAATPEATLLATASAAESLAGELGWSGDLSLAEALDATLGPLRRAGVSASTLFGGERPRARVVARVLERTDALLDEARLYDDRAAGWHAARGLQAGAAADLASPVVIDGLVHWDAATCAWVEALARRVPVTVRLPRPTDTRFAELARAVDVVLSGLEARWQQLSDAPDLELVDAGVPSAIRLIEAASDAAEARVVVRLIAEQLARGVSAERIAVLVPDLDEVFLEPLRAAFDDAAIPFAEPRGKPASAAPAVHAALAWLALASSPLHRNGCIELLQSEAVDPAPFIEGGTRELRRRRALALVRRLSRMPVGSDPEGALMLDVLRGEVELRPHEAWMLTSLSRLIAAVRAAQSDRPRCRMAEELKGTWAAMGLAASDLTMVAEWTRSTSPGSAQALARGLRERSVGLRALFAASERVVEAAALLRMDEQPVSPARFGAELAHALENAAPDGTMRPGSVRVVRASDVAGLDTDVLIAARASEESFVGVPADHVLLGEEVRRACAAERRPLAVAELAAAKGAELLAAFSRTTSLILTRARSDHSGRARSAAALFSELAASHGVELEPASFLHAPALVSASSRRLVALARGAPPADPDVARRVDAERERARFFADPSVAPGAASGLIALPDDAARDHLQASIGGTVARPIAATAIERAAQCRFAAFALRVLGAGGEDELGEGLQPWQRGSLIHRGLHIAFAALAAEWDELSRAELARRAADAARDELLRGKSSLLYRAEVERALRDVVAVVLWSFDDASGFRFAHGELAFGEVSAAAAPGRRSDKARRDAPWPPLVVGEGALRIRVKGRIDRVDLTRDGSRARVLDYKSGSLPAWKDVGTLYFQPALYAHAVWQQLGRLSIADVRALYLDTSRRPPRMLPAEKSQVIGIDQIAEADRAASLVVGRMWRGDVAPRPVNAAVCARCQVRDVCRRPAAMPIEELEPEGEGAT